jgi:uncharacterized RDD family membrane protein YckC
MGLMGAATIVVTMLVFYIGSFGHPDFRGWLDRSFDRELLPSPVLLFLAAAWLSGRTGPKAGASLGKAAPAADSGIKV